MKIKLQEYFVILKLINAKHKLTINAKNVIVLLF